MMPAAAPMSPTPTTSASSAARQPGPWLRRIEGLNVLKVAGSPYQMGKQHGELLGDAVRRGPIPYYRTYLERMMGRAGWGPLAPLAWPLVQRLVGDRVVRALPDYARDAICGLADGAGLDRRELLEGCALPDSLLWVASRVMQLKGVGPAMHHRLALGLGCTSAIAWNGATRDGKLLHARNFDYHGVACWPETTTVIFHEPDEGLRYVSVAAAGVLLGGVTAMNEAGLTLTVHQHMFTDRTALGGTPIGCVGDEIMRKAHDLDEAEAILRAQRPIGCWTYLVTDGHRREVMCWEENPERQALVRRGGAAEEGLAAQAPRETFGYANIYLDRELGDTEKNLYGSYWRNNLGRHRRAGQLLQQQAGGLDPDAMAAILADQGDGACRVAAAIGMVMTVGSVVFRPEDGVFWVGSGAAPTSQRPFVPFDLHGERHAPEHGTVVGGVASDPVAAEAYEAYRRAYLAYFDDHDVPAARAHAERAAALEPSQPLWHALVGLLSLRLGDGAAAFPAFSRCLDLGHEHEERIASFHLWRGRAADLSGRREQGLRDYRAALGHHADPPVHRAATQGLKRPFDTRRALHIDVDLTYIDVVTP